MIHNFSQEQVKEIIRMYKEGIDIDSIIEFFGTDEHNIRCVLKENQIDRVYNTFEDELYQRLIYLYSDCGYTQAKISYELLISDHCIRKTLIKGNIKRKTPSEYNQKYSRNSNYFDVIDNENKAYFLGLIYADGNNYYVDNKFAITISLQERDGYLVEKFAEEIDYAGLLHYDELSVVDSNHKNQIRIVVNDEHMSNQLASLGVINNKSLVLKFPDFIPDEYLRHFVRGFFDGDGGLYYYDKEEKLSTNTTSTFEFLSGLQNILNNKLGCKCNIHKPRPDLDSNTYILQTCGNKSSLKFLSWIYDDCDIKMMRKYNIYRCVRINYETKMKTRKINDLYE